MSSHEEPVAAALVAFLESEGAAGLPHGRGRTLLDHLRETCAIVQRWGQPVWLQRAALIHSVYGTESYAPQLVSTARRAEVAAAAGGQAERLAYLFSATPRRPLFAGMHLWARELPSRSTDDDSDPPTRSELDALVLLHMANLAEQTRSADGSPGLWLAQIRELADLLIDSGAITPPLFTAQLAAFDPAEESLARRAYLDGIGEGDALGTSALALAAAICPVVPEPCLRLAGSARRDGDEPSARSWAAQARRRLGVLGTTWDKRLSFEECTAMIDGLERSPDEAGPRTPRALAPPDDYATRRRFHRYVEGFDGDGGSSSGMIYPDLPSRPWHDPRDFPLVGYLETHFEEIREEITALGETRFQRESERIGRTGDWDVAFLYERGRRHDEVCVACPVTTHGIETYPTIRTMAGLIYVSRLRAETHVAAHRGPTNLRVRCHLAVKVPDGDCALRVGEETRRWEEGKCLVFDDYFEHEAWNHSAADRIVLIVDLWHPALSATEVALLEGLHGYAFLHARRLGRYWAANAHAAEQARHAPA